MRGSDQSTGSLFSYVDLEERVPARHPLRKIKTVVDAALATLDADFERLYARRRPPVDCARAAHAREPRADPVLDPLGTSVDGAVAVQSALPLVRRAVDRRARVGADGLHQEPRPSADDGDVAQADGGDPRAREGRAALVGRSFLRRRHAGRGMGFVQELPPEIADVRRAATRRRSAAACCDWRGTKGVRHGGDGAGEIEQDEDDGPTQAQDEPIDHRAKRRARLAGQAWSNATHASVTDPDARTLPQGQRPPRAALLHGPRPDREPARLGGRGRTHARRRHRRTARCDRHDRSRSHRARRSRSHSAPTRATTSRLRRNS